MIKTTVLRIRAARGWNWIDQHGTTYQLDLDRVNVARLNMTNNERCILGQAYYGTLRNGFSDGFQEVLKALVEVEPTKLAKWLVDHGFDLVQNPADNTGDTWDRLRMAWIELLEGTAP